MDCQRISRQKMGASTALAIALAVGCGAHPGDEWSEAEEVTLESVEQPIENGTAVSSGLGAVRIQGASVPGSCSGFIIGPRTLLTAAHCISGSGDVNVQLRVDYWDANKWFCLSERNVTERQCTRDRSGTAWTNPRFVSGDRARDFAVVSMDRDFSYVASAHKIMLMEEPDINAIGTYNVIGYGVNSDTDNTPRSPRRARFELAKLGTKTFYSYADDEHICAGDSGSPQYDTSGSSRYAFGLHSGRRENNGNCADDGDRQEGPLVWDYVDNIERHLGRSCRHFNNSKFGHVADCW